MGRPYAAPRARSANGPRKRREWAYARRVMVGVRVSGNWRWARGSGPRPWRNCRRRAPRRRPRTRARRSRSRGGRGRRAAGRRRAGWRGSGWRRRERPRIWRRTRRGEAAWGAFRRLDADGAERLSPRFIDAAIAATVRVDPTRPPEMTRVREVGVEPYVEPVARCELERGVAHGDMVAVRPSRPVLDPRGQHAERGGGEEPRAAWQPFSERVDEHAGVLWGGPVLPVEEVQVDRGGADPRQGLVVLVAPSLHRGLAVLKATEPIPPPSRRPFRRHAGEDVDDDDVLTRRGEHVPGRQHRVVKVWGEDHDHARSIVARRGRSVNRARKERVDRRPGGCTPMKRAPTTSPWH